MYEAIDDQARVWTVTLGDDGRLRAELDEHLLATLDAMAAAAALSADDQLGAHHAESPQLPLRLPTPPGEEL